MKKTDFLYSTKAEPHRSRTKSILREHPNLRQLMGKNPATIYYIVLLVSIQLVLAFLLRDQSWWLILGVSYLVGAFADHGLFVMIHECTHQLVFRGKTPNRLAALLANVPQIFPSAIAFERYHIKHHSFQGVHELDADLPNRWEAKLINNYFIGKIIWLLFYPFFQLFRVQRLKELQHFDAWTFANIAVQVVFTALFWFFVGPKAIVYLLLSFFFSVGLHPLGARWIQEHYLVHGEQETYSYYGKLNHVAFNVGYHNEHHDFPSIPWNRLPKVREAAPAHYDTLYYHTSWVRLFFRFLFDQEISLYSRIVRKERGRVQLTDQSMPDKELVEQTL
jgi:sphingolipid 4-desaturase/C4-monooxygenase